MNKQCDSNTDCGNEAAVTIFGNALCWPCANKAADVIGQTSPATLLRAGGVLPVETEEQEQQVGDAHERMMDAIGKVLGRLREKCLACNGSGHYDRDGSPPCAACDGTGLEPVR